MGFETKVHQVIHMIQVVHHSCFQIIPTMGVLKPLIKIYFCNPLMRKEQFVINRHQPSVFRVSILDLGVKKTWRISTIEAKLFFLFSFTSTLPFPFPLLDYQTPRNDKTNTIRGPKERVELTGRVTKREDQVRNESNSHSTSSGEGSRGDQG